jgi:hypothetical protein
MKMPKNVDLSKSINREKVIEPSIANNEKNIECPPLLQTEDLKVPGPILGRGKSAILIQIKV